MAEATEESVPEAAAAGQPYPGEDCGEFYYPKKTTKHQLSVLASSTRKKVSVA
jgi:hypothetical protein